MNSDNENQGKGDNVDAKGFHWWPNKESGPKATLNIAPNAEMYNMTNRNRGKCLIFNNQTFESHTNLSCRRGSAKDASDLYTQFRTLDFDVATHTDLKKHEILALLKKEAREDHTEDDCFVCCILSHGDQGVIFGSDGKFPVDQIFEPFFGDACPSLAGKPKLFFIQACQGDRLDAGVKVAHKLESADSASICKIPTHADFLIVYSTVPGFYSWRNTADGSWFIQSFCSVLEKYGRNNHLLDMMTIVNRHVAYNFESRVVDNPQMNMMKQVPFITSTLTRKVYFPCKLGNAMT